MTQMTAEELLLSLCGTAAERSLALRSIYADTALRQKVGKWVGGHGGSKEEAEENFQDALVIFDRNIRLGKFTGAGTWEGYFFGIARFCWLERLRHRKPATTELLPVHLDNKIESFELRFMEEERKAVLRQALENMGGRCNEILTPYKSGISYQEMAEQLGLSSADMAKKECYRCRQRFREYLLQRPELLKYLKDDNTDE